jgi:tRNA threonylcarbamoyladenosine biosynthesis protein TsaE
MAAASGIERGVTTILAQQTSLEVTTGSAHETHEVGELVGRLLQPGHVVALVGELGAGKTCLTQGIAAGLGVERSVTSPTFILVNEYTTARGMRLCHVDCYRFATDGTSEAVGIGLDELLGGDSICVVEWADRVAALLPPEHLWVVLSYVDHTTRHLRFTAYGDRHGALLSGLIAQTQSSATRAIDKGLPGSHDSA